MGWWLLSLFVLGVGVLAMLGGSKPTRRIATQPNPQEPAITINGFPLTTAQAMTARVAIESFASTLAAEGLGDDDRGRSLTAAYLDRITEIQCFLYAVRPQRTPHLTERESP